jgi:hypothetical protein
MHNIKGLEYRGLRHEVNCNRATKTASARYPLKVKFAPARATAASGNSVLVFAVGDGNHQSIESTARSVSQGLDATVGSVTDNIVATFGLPPGSVIIIAPDRRKQPRDAKIARLKERWRDE